MTVASKKELAQYDSDIPEPKSQKTQLRAAVAAHLHGFSYDVIAERYRYSSAKTAQVAVEKALGETYTSSDVVAARNKSLARKEHLMQSVWYDATHPYQVDEDGRRTSKRNEAHLPALDRAIRIGESIDRLLGLQAPTQVEIYRPGSEEFLETITTLKAELLRGQPQEGDIFDAEIVDDEGEPQ